MPWETSNRKAQLPKNWPALRQAALERCGWRCEKILPSGTRCPRTATDVDHIRPGSDHRMSNLRGLCADHHSRKSSLEGLVARLSGKRKKKPEEQHPGWRG